MANEHAQALGKLRWKGKTEEEKAEHARMMARKSWASRRLKKKRTPPLTS